MNVQALVSKTHATSYNEIDKLRLRRTVHMLVLYWIGVVLLGVFMPDGPELQGWQSTARFVVGRFDGVMQAASRSFDPNYIEVLAAFCLSWSVLLAVASLFWLPRGSHVTFLGWRYKLAMLLIGAIMLAAAWVVPEATQKMFSLRDGRSSALLLLGTSTRPGAIVVLGGLWGFAQLFFFQVFRIIFISPVRA